MNNPAYLGLSLLDLCKTVMHEFWYDYVKPKYGENKTLCYMDTGSFIVHWKTKNSYKDIADIETRFHTSNFKLARPLPKGKNKESNWTNERWIRWKNHGRMFSIKSKSIYLFKRKQWWR